MSNRGVRDTVYVRAYVHACVRACVRACARVCVCARVRARMCVCVQKLLEDLCKLEHLPHKLVKGEAGLQTAWGLLRCIVPSRFLHVLRGHAVEITAEFCDDVQETIHRILGQWTDQGGLAAGQQRIVELPIEHGGLGFLPVKAANCSQAFSLRVAP